LNFLIWSGPVGYVNNLAHGQPFGWLSINLKLNTKECRNFFYFNSANGIKYKNKEDAVGTESHMEFMLYYNLQASSLIQI
jgi:hypothetical protein